MLHRSLAFAGVLTLSLTTLISADPSVTPPVAKRVERREVRHGATVVDHYYWLREKSNPEVVHYLEAENAYTEAMTKDIKTFEAALYQEMLGRIKQTDLSVPVRRDGYFYYSRTEEGKQYPIQCRRKGSMEAPEEVLLDLNELAKGHTFLGPGRVHRQRRFEPAGLHHRHHRFPPIHAAREGSAHRRTRCPIPPSA